MKNLILLAMAALSLMLVGCGDAPVDPNESAKPTQEAMTEAPLPGGPAPGTLDPGSGQATTPGKMGLPGNKGGK